MAAGTGIVTPEAVPLEFADAGIGSRGIALLIDGLVVATALLIVTIGASTALEAAPVPDWAAVSTVLILSLVLFFGYPIVAEVAFGGRSLGKAALGLRVVTREGAPVGFRHAAIRSLFMLVDFVATGGVAAVLSAAFTRRSQRLGDLVAGTVVLRGRQATGAVRAAHFALPPGAQAYAERLGAGTVDAAGYDRIRRFLLRAPELEPAARRRIAVAIAEPLLATTPTPPAGMDPVTYLQTLAAVYQRGHGAADTSPQRGRGDGASTPPPPPAPTGVPRADGTDGDRGFVAPD